MEVTRVFHPVGQGGFYTEAFDDNHMVVYDCGGTSHIDVERCIDSLFTEQKSPQIEAVFISHLHEDHINGLQYLLKKSKTKRLFLPQFSREKVFEALFYNATQASAGSNINNYIVSIVDAVRSGHNFIGDSRIVTISEEDNTGEVSSYSLDSIFPSSIPSGAHLVKDEIWVYIPYNSKSQKPNFSKILNNYRKPLQNIYKEDSAEKQAQAIAKFVEQYSVKTCKEIYKLLYGGIHNSQSMPMFSGLIHKCNDIYIHSMQDFPHVYIEGWIGEHCRFRSSANVWFHCFDECEYCVEYNHALCSAFRDDKVICNFLYTGDFEAKKTNNMELLRRFYKRHGVWNSICGVQIPHHGSRYNYHSDLYEDSYYAIASAGKYSHHPHPETFKNISKQKCLPLLVTEDTNTKIQQHFKI